MLELILTRGPSTPDGTFGILEGEALRMFTGELPWKDNKLRLSCIPLGSYMCSPRVTGKKGKHYILSDTEPRSGILIHAGNFCGDRELGKRSDVLGCILLGMGLGQIEGQQVITQSRLAIKKFLEYTEFKPFTLEIR